MGRIEEKFKALKKEGRKTFVAYLTAGDPDLKTTLDLIPALESAHAVAHTIRTAPAMTKGMIVIVNLSGRGDKDAETIAAMREGKG